MTIFAADAIFCCKLNINIILSINNKKILQLIIFCDIMIKMQDAPAKVFDNNRRISL